LVVQGNDFVSDEETCGVVECVEGIHDLGVGIELGLVP
jgi:hypothetical protein